MNLGCAIVNPQDGVEHTHTVIFLHDRGSEALELSDKLFYLGDSSKQILYHKFPSVRWYFPQARHIRCERDDQDCSQWYDIWNTLDFSDEEDMQLPGLHDSVKGIIGIIHYEAQKVGGLDKIVLAGFGQGGSTAVHALLNLPAFEAPTASLKNESDTALTKRSKTQHLAGFMGFNCVLPFPGGTLEETREVLGIGSEPSDEILRHTPVFLAHSVDDPLVFVEYGRQLATALESFGALGVSREYPTGGHKLNAPQEIDDIALFLKTQGIPTRTVQEISLL